MDNIIRRNPYSVLGWFLFVVTLFAGVFNVDISQLVFPQNKLSVQISSDPWIIPDFEGTRRVNYLGGIPEPSMEVLYSVRSLWNFTVTNNGSKEAKDIEAYIPLIVGMYAIDNLKPKKIENDVVKLGDLKPGAVRYFNIWSTNLLPNGLGREDVHISYESGLAKLHFSREITGVKLLVAENLLMIVLIIILLAIMLPVIFLDGEKRDSSIKAGGIGPPS